MSEYFNPPATSDSLDVIEQARREIDRRAWTSEDGHDLTAHLHASRQYLDGYLRALEQFGLVSVTIFNQLQATMEHALEKVQDEDKQ
jgi:hypothetical protein